MSNIAITDCLFLIRQCRWDQGAVFVCADTARCGSAFVDGALCHRVRFERGEQTGRCQPRRKEPFPNQDVLKRMKIQEKKRRWQQELRRGRKRTRLWRVIEQGQLIQSWFQDEHDLKCFLMCWLRLLEAMPGSRAATCRGSANVFNERKLPAKWIRDAIT